MWSPLINPRLTQSCSQCTTCQKSWKTLLLNSLRDSKESALRVFWNSVAKRPPWRKINNTTMIHDTCSPTTAMIKHTKNSFLRTAIMLITYSTHSVRIWWIYLWMKLLCIGSDTQTCKLATFTLTYTRPFWKKLLFITMRFRNKSSQVMWSNGSSSWWESSNIVERSSKNPHLN